jgi:hypothetical protein
MGALAAAGAVDAQVPASNDTSDGRNNTGMGTHTLFSNTTGYDNTASGYGALYSNTIGYDNTASGYQALALNTFGRVNTAAGFQALYSNTYGSYNTASGYQALYSNTGGYDNTASGESSLFSNTTGYENTASGYAALGSNTTGNANTASGGSALNSNTTGSNNTAAGYEALENNLSGLNNTAVGGAALFSNKAGTANVALGANAGYNITGSNNVDIAVRGNAQDSGVIRIGTPGSQVSTYISGIENSKVTGAAVYVTASGQLGVLASSERYKTAITSMGSASERLRRLRPVAFHLKSQPGIVQYGLIAEEVERVYPELVIRDSDGNIQGVRYDELAPMLLNEVQKQDAQIRHLKQQQKQFATRSEVNELKHRLQAALAVLQPKDGLVAQR